MTVIQPFTLTGKVEATLVAHQFGSIVSTQTSRIYVIKERGVREDRHNDVRHADVRERELINFGLPKGLELSQTRGVSAISTEERTAIGIALNLPSAIPFGCFGENLILSGIRDLTQLPIGTLLFFHKGSQLRSAILHVWRPNEPCHLPADAIRSAFGEREDINEQTFRAAADGKRGLVFGVYASGYIQAGDTVVAYVPEQRLYYRPLI